MRVVAHDAIVRDSAGRVHDHIRADPAARSNHRVGQHIAGSPQLHIRAEVGGRMHQWWQNKTNRLQFLKYRLSRIGRRRTADPHERHPYTAVIKRLQRTIRVDHLDAGNDLRAFGKLTIHRADQIPATSNRDLANRGAMTAAADQNGLHSRHLWSAVRTFACSGLDLGHADASGFGQERVQIDP